MAPPIFSVPVFFITFRESLEVVLIIAIQLTFLKQLLLDGSNPNPAVYRKYSRQIWLALALSILLTLAISGALIGVFYTLRKDKWAEIELYWEGAFALLASAIITVVGAAMLRMSRMKEAWRARLERRWRVEGEKSKGGWRGDRDEGILKESSELEKEGWMQKYAMFVLPFVTVLREGIEAVVFIAGVSFTTPATSIPIPVIVGLIAGAIVGYLVYRGGSSTKLQYFLILSTCLLYLVAAGLFSKGVWYFEQAAWNKAVGGNAVETGAGPGSYDVDRSVWHINYGSPYINAGAGWGVFNAILGWQNSATYGSVVAYNVYWIVVVAGFGFLRWKEKRRWAEQCKFG